MKNNTLKIFIWMLINNKGNRSIKSIADNLHYNETYIVKMFRQFTHRSAQYYMNYCRIIFVLYAFINGTNISVARKKYCYKENAFNRALRTYKFPTIKKINGDDRMKEFIRREYDKIRLLNILSNASKPVKAKALGNLCQYIEEFRKCREFCICSKPGPQGGYFISNDANDISVCETWINRWRVSRQLANNFSLT